MECPNCTHELFRLEGLCTDRDDMREDAYCAYCHIRYGVRAHGLVVLVKRNRKGECKYKDGCIHYTKEIEGIV